MRLSVLALAAVLAGALAGTARACPYNQQVVQQQVVTQVAVPVLQTVAVPVVPVVQSQVVVAQAAQVYAAPAVVQAAPVVVQQKNVFVQQRQVKGRGFQGGFGGGPLRQGFQSGGILGAAERLTGLGDGSGQVGTGVLLGVLGARSNLFGLGRR